MANKGEQFDPRMELLEEVSFQYSKSPFYRAIYVDGVIGSITPKGKLFFSLFSEHAALPEKTTHKVNPDGALGEAIGDKSTAFVGLTREIEVAIYADLDVVKELRSWLDERIKDLEKFNAARPKMIKE